MMLVFLCMLLHLLAVSCVLQQLNRTVSNDNIVSDWGTGVGQTAQKGVMPLRES